MREGILAGMDGLLGLAVCGAPLASRSAEVATALVAAGWSLQVRASHAAVDWIDPEELSAAARAPVQIRRLPPTSPFRRIRRWRWRSR